MEFMFSAKHIGTSISGLLPVNLDSMNDAGPIDESDGMLRVVFFSKPEVLPVLFQTG